MALITKSDDGFLSVTRPMGLTNLFDGRTQSELEVLCTAPFVLDLYDTLRDVGGEDAILHLLVEGVVRVGHELGYWDGPETEHAFRSAVWRSAHHYVVNNVARVDRGTELNALAKLMGVDRK